MSNKHIIISGAGIGGLTAALCLVKSGYRVTVFEQASELKAVGAGLQLSANATRVLDELGLEQALNEVTVKSGGKCVRLWNTGQEWQLFDLSEESIVRYGHAYRMLYRPDLHRILVDALAHVSPGALRLGCKVASVGQDAQGVHVTLADGSTHRSDVLVGADGVHSITRETLIAKDSPRFSGCIAWRGVIPLADLPESMQSSKGMNWIGPGAHIVHYPINGGRLVSFTGIVEKEVWFRESWTEQGAIAECREDFKGWHPDIQAFIDQLGLTPLRWAMMLRDPLTNWTNGRVTLLGDAAHPTLPFLAQGAAMGIEDARILARALDAHPDDAAYALQVYQSTRIARTTRIVKGSAENTKRFHNRELATPEDAVAYIAREFEEKTVRARYDWLFCYAPESTPLIDPPRRG
jgi:salicylate hydroxylase